MRRSGIDAEIRYTTIPPPTAFIIIPRQESLVNELHILSKSIISFSIIITIKLGISYLSYSRGGHNLAFQARIDPERRVIVYRSPTTQIKSASFSYSGFRF